MPVLTTNLKRGHLSADPSGEKTLTRRGTSIPAEGKEKN